MHEHAQKLGRQGAQAEEPDEQELVVVVDVGLKDHNLGDEPEEEEPTGDLPVLPGEQQQREGQQQKQPAQILDIEPQEGVHLVGPVEMETDHAAF